MYRRRSSDVLYFILFYESVHQSDFIKSVLCLYKSVFEYFEFTLQIFARALPESVIFRRDFYGILPELRQIQHYCQRSVIYPET